MITLDPTAIAALLGVIGPIELDSVDQTIDEDNAVDYLLRRQYELNVQIENAGRHEALGELAGATIDALLAGGPAADPTDPVELLEQLGPQAVNGHLMAWSPDPEIEAMYEQLGIAGRFERPTDVPDALAVLQLNAGGNKMDAYLQRTYDYRATLDRETGELTGVVTVVLANTAVADEVPDYAKLSATDDPPGANRMFLTLYGNGWTGISETADGVVTQPQLGTEHGWQFAQTQVLLLAEQQITLRYELSRDDRRHRAVRAVCPRPARRAPRSALGRGRRHRRRSGADLPRAARTEHRAHRRRLTADG